MQKTDIDPFVEVQEDSSMDITFSSLRICGGDSNKH